MTTSKFSATTKQVRRQYEDLPYPQRNPADEKKRLCQTSLDDLMAVNQYCFSGRKNFERKFRVLVAGGGTGDSLIYLGHQLQKTNAELVYIDLSNAAMKIARCRAQYRGFEKKITWLQGSLLDLPQMGLGQFDYINCSGVLHHLEEPEAGLAALRSVLKDDGAMGIMVYGQYGRTGVYQMQELVRLINRDETDSYIKVHNTRNAIESLPPTNWFRKGGGLTGLTSSPNDAEIYDMFLHTQDRAYTVPQLYEFLATAGLNFVEITPEHRALYEPRLVVQDPHMLQLLDSRSLAERRAIGENLNGTITKHAFWASTRTDSQIDLFDPENIPSFSRFAKTLDVGKSILSTTEGDWTFKMKRSSGFQLTIKLDPVPAAKRFVELIDDHRTMEQIVTTIADEYDPRPSDEEVWKVCRRVIEILGQCDLILLRHKSVPAVKTW